MKLRRIIFNFRNLEKQSTHQRFQTVWKIIITQGYLQIHLSIQNECLVADANIYIVTIGFFHTNWSFAGNATITGENSLVETT